MRIAEVGFFVCTGIGVNAAKLGAAGERSFSCGRELEPSGILFAWFRCVNELLKRESVGVILARTGLIAMGE